MQAQYFLHSQHYTPYNCEYTNAQEPDGLWYENMDIYALKTYQICIK